MESTILALVPPLLAIIISLITKEVNLSLIIGIIVGAGIYNDFNPFTTLTTSLGIMGTKVHDNLGVLVFIVLLGMIVHLMNLSGATHKYAQWARTKIKTKKQTMLATMFLGMLIFVDDYFNCLTVGTVMRPITDSNRISREKLAYIIDSTAAPICIIAPVSSWAAAVSSSLPDGSAINGFTLFMESIANNYYSWFSLAMILVTTLFAVDFGKMRVYSKEAEEKGVVDKTIEVSTEYDISNKGKIFDLLLPVAMLIVLSIASMLYTGGLYDGNKLISEAFAECDAILGLAMGAAYTVLFLAILYLPRKIVSPKVFMEGLIEGFKTMVPASLILIFAWTLSGVCGSDYLNAGGFVAKTVEEYSISLQLMPPVFFLISLLLAFSTGSSWGAFTILLPITVAIFNDQLVPLTVITTAAVLGGSVCGDHISPISDTTILSSTGAGCSHINHVSTQLQYGVVVAVISFLCYIVTGLTENTWLGMIIGLTSIVIVVLWMKAYYGNLEKNKYD